MSMIKLILWSHASYLRIVNGIYDKKGNVTGVFRLIIVRIILSVMVYNLALNRCSDYFSEM